MSFDEKKFHEFAQPLIDEAAKLVQDKLSSIIHMINEEYPDGLPLDGTGLGTRRDMVFNSIGNPVDGDSYEENADSLANGGHETGYVAVLRFGLMPCKATEAELSKAVGLVTLGLGCSNLDLLSLLR